MLTISLPPWMIMVLAGVPGLCLLGLVAYIIGKKRKDRAATTEPSKTAAAVGQISFCGQIHHQVLTQQIDAIFNALVAVIETERIKLKALVNASQPQASAALTPADHAALWEDLPKETAMESDPEIGQSIAAYAAEGATPEDIARRLGVSQAEVALALKMRSPGNEQRASRLSAVV